MWLSLLSSEASDSIQVAAPYPAAGDSRGVDSPFSAYCELEVLAIKEHCGGGGVGIDFLTVPWGCGVQVASLVVFKHR